MCAEPIFIQELTGALFRGETWVFQNGNSQAIRIPQEMKMDKKITALIKSAISISHILPMIHGPQLVRWSALFPQISWRTENSRTGRIFLSGRNCDVPFGHKYLHLSDEKYVRQHDRKNLIPQSFWAVDLIYHGIRIRIRRWEEQLRWEDQT